MLKSDAAQERLKAWKFVAVKTDEDDDDDHVGSLEAGRARFAGAIEKLPAKLRRIAFGLLGCDEKGKLVADEDPSSDPRQAAPAELDRLSSKDRLQILKTFFPRMGADVARAWEALRGAPYQLAYNKKAFRATGDHAASLAKRSYWLGSLLQLGARYRDEAMTPAWLAAWAPYLEGDCHDASQVIGLLAASTIDAGGQLGDEVFEILCSSGRNDHEVGDMGSHVILGLLAASREEGWEFIEKMLVAAQRQEGLRQTILEAIDLSHPEAFQRMLRLILDQGFVRFSAVVRAVNIWLGYQWAAESPGVINRTLERLAALLQDAAARKKALAGTDAELVYLALWTMAFEDAAASIAPAEKLLRHKSPEIRFAALTHLKELDLPAALTAAWQVSDDETLRIAVQAANSSELGCWRPYGAENPLAKTDAFERVERLLTRLPEKPVELPAILWPWTKMKISREQYGRGLLDLLGDRPVTRLVPHLASLDSWRRREVIERFAKQKTWDPATRAALIDLAGDTSADVRTAAFGALRKIELTDPEIERLEGTLTRKAGDLRSGVIGLILNRSDEKAFVSADRLTGSKDGLQRLAGLETLRQLVERGRSPAGCLERAERFLATRPKPAKDEKLQLDVILRAQSAKPALSLDNGLGLMDPAKRTPARSPRRRKVKFVTPAAIAVLKELDDLLHKHRETTIIVDTYRQKGESILLGNAGYAFPQRNVSRPREVEAAKLPLREVWEGWFSNRSKKTRDADGLELHRADRWWDCVTDYHYKEFRKWVGKKAYRKGMLSTLDSEKPPALKYPDLVTKLVHWLLFLSPPEGAVPFLMDCVEELCAAVPSEELEALRRSDDEEGEESGSWRMYGEDWRGWGGVLNTWSRSIESSYDALPPAELERRWQLAHWLDEPIPGASRHRPDNELLLAAYARGFASLHDIVDTLLGDPRFSLLGEMTKRRPEAATKRFLEAYPEVSDLVDRIRVIVVDSELERGDVPAATSEVAHAIESLTGIDTLVRLLGAVGKSGFKLHTGWRAEGKLQRIPTLTALAKATYPAAEETPEGFARRMKQEVLAKSFPEDRLIELAFLAPQWTKHVEAYFAWDGLAEGLYWFLAHMRFMWGSDAGEQAAESAGIDSGDDEAATEDADDDSGKGEPVRKLSSWERLILERTALSDLDRGSGAIDVGWFRRVYAALGAKRWERLAQSAKFASNAAQAKKAQLIADVLLGEANLEELIGTIEKRYLKESVRLIGLYPLPAGAKRDAELSRRYKVLQEYGRYARTLSGLTKPEALRSLEIGLKNLASTAGYADALRLGWALGASEWSDLRAGPVAESKDGVTVTLAIDDAVEPQIAVSKGGKELKSAPPAVKKHPPIAGLYERARELKRQASRQKKALEEAMCRGDEFSAAEFVELSRHALVAPFLERLVLVGEGILGYPDKGGKALRDHAGKLEPVKKSERLRIAHPHDLFQGGDWSAWQREAFQAERIQPFKQVFRELYVVSKAEKASGNRSERYAGQQIQPSKALALWGSRGWNTADEVFKVFYQDEIVASVQFRSGVTTPLEVEGLTLDAVTFSRRNARGDLKLTEVPPRLFSETMRDLDLVVSVAHSGGVDPEASASTVEMRSALIREASLLLGLKNVRLKGTHALIEGELASYTVHLGSGTVHRMPGGALCVVPVYSQHRGRLFLPFADDDPRTAEILSKILLFARDHEIQDPGILSQIRM